MPEKMIFWGAAGQAKVLYQCLIGADVELLAVFDNNCVPSPFHNVPVFYGESGFMDWHSLYQNEKIYFLVTIGGSKGKDRLKIQDWLQQEGLIPYTAIHNTAILPPSVVIGSGSQILAGSVVSVDTQLGRACIINTGAIIDHECIIGDGVHICPGAVLAGCVKIEKYAMIGSGSVILPRIKVHEGAIIGAGSVVTRHVPPYTVVAGNPARIIRRFDP